MVYLVDGQTEKSFVEAFKRMGNISPGKVSIINISEKSPQQVVKSVNLLTERKTKKITIITDADTLNDPSERARFMTNVNALRDHKFINELNLVLQYNLEDEIQKSLAIPHKDLLKMFNAEGIGEMKSEICGKTPANLFKKISILLATDFWKCRYHRVTDEILLRSISQYFSEVLLTGK